jgi:hypothetical protein
LHVWPQSGDGLVSLLHRWRCVVVVVAAAAFNAAEPEPFQYVFA